VRAGGDEQQQEHDGQKKFSHHHRQRLPSGRSRKPGIKSRGFRLQAEGLSLRTRPALETPLILRLQDSFVAARSEYAGADANQIAAANRSERRESLRSASY
jgi:hypothetical protein